MKKKKIYKKNYKNKRSKDEIRAYWIGVGISSAIHGEAQSLLESKNLKFRSSIRKGYQDDNFKDISKKYK